MLCMSPGLDLYGEMGLIQAKNVEFKTFTQEILGEYVYYLGIPVELSVKCQMEGQDFLVIEQLGNQFFLRPHLPGVLRLPKGAYFMMLLWEFVEQADGIVAVMPPIQHSLYEVMISDEGVPA